MGIRKKIRSFASIGRQTAKIASALEPLTKSPDKETADIALEIQDVAQTMVRLSDKLRKSLRAATSNRLLIARRLEVVRQEITDKTET